MGVWLRVWQRGAPLKDQAAASTYGLGSAAGHRSLGHQVVTLQTGDPSAGPPASSGELGEGPGPHSLSQPMEETTPRCLHPELPAPRVRG